MCIKWDPQHSRESQRATATYFSTDGSQKYNDAGKKQVTEKYIPDDFTYVRFKNMQSWTTYYAELQMYMVHYTEQWADERLNSGRGYPRGGERERTREEGDGFVLFLKLGWGFDGIHFIIIIIF